MNINLGIVVIIMSMPSLQLVYFLTYGLYIVFDHPRSCVVYNFGRDVVTAYLHGVRVELVHDGNRVKVEVTGATKFENSYSDNVKLWSTITSVVSRAVCMEQEYKIRYCGHCNVYTITPTDIVSEIFNSFWPPTKLRGRDVCHTLTFESLDIGSSYLHMRHISMEYGSS